MDVQMKMMAHGSGNHHFIQVDFTVQQDVLLS